MRDDSPTFFQRIANILTTTLLLILTVLVVVFIAFLAFPDLFPAVADSQPPVVQEEVAQLPTVAAVIIVPTETNTPIPPVPPTNTPPATETFSAPSATPTKQAVSTPTPTAELGDNDLIPPTLTPTPTKTPTPTPTPVSYTHLTLPTIYTV